MNLSKMFVTLSLVFVLVGCQSATEKQFMQGCSQGSFGNDKVCSCVYKNIKDIYGEDKLEKMNKTGYVPSDFADAMVASAKKCQAE